MNSKNDAELVHLARSGNRDFLRAWLNFDLLSDPANFVAWLRRIVFGVSIDRLRVFRSDLYRFTDAQAELDLSRPSAHTESALERLEAIELRQRIWDARTAEIAIYAYF